MIYDPLLDGFEVLWAVFTVLVLIGTGLLVLFDGFLQAFLGIKGRPERRKRFHLAAMKRIVSEMSDGGE